MITDDEDQRAPFSYGQISLEYAIRGFHSVELMETEYEATESVLVNLLDYLEKLLAPIELNPLRFASTEG